MTTININTNLLKSSAESSLNEIKSNLNSAKNFASGLSSSVVFQGSDKIKNIPSKINECVAGINNTIEWYNSCCKNYDHFTNDSINEIESLEVNKFEIKDFKI